MTQGKRWMTCARWKSLMREYYKYRANCLLEYAVLPVQVLNLTLLAFNYSVHLCISQYTEGNRMHMVATLTTSV